MEKLNRAQNCLILGPQNLGSKGGLGPQGPLDPRLGQTPSHLGKHPLSRYPPAADTPPPRQTPHPRDGHCNRRYASHWNAMHSSCTNILLCHCRCTRAPVLAISVLSPGRGRGVRLTDLSPVIPCLCRCNVNAFTCCHETHFVYCHCHHN